VDISVVFPVTTLTQADTWDILIPLANYPANLWTLTYVLKQTGSNPISIVSVPAADGTTLELKATHTQTASFLPGVYQASAFVTCISDGERFTLGTTQITITPDLLTSNAEYDGRTQNQQILDEINSALALCLGDSVVEYTIGGKSIKKNKTELLKMKTFYTSQVRKDNGRKQGNLIRYGFVSGSINQMGY